MARVNLYDSNALMSAYRQSRTQRPRVVRSGAPPPRPGLIPGFGEYRDTKNAMTIAQRKAQYDGTYPAPKRRAPKRAPYRGRRRTPRIDNRNYPNPGRRPQVN
jgi:hypothetical protein